MTAAKNRQIPAVSRPLWAASLKRLIDIIGAVVGLVVLSPLMLAIALAVLVCDGWPIFFTWRVVGLGGHPFVGYKFRTMVRNAEQLENTLAEQNEVDGPTFKLRNDPRVTPLGRLLRRTSLDELPQFLSVLRGDMSLVGPRPSRVEEFSKFTDIQRSRVAVKPGITCIWQVSGRNNITDFETRLRLDQEYIDNWSIWLDFRILLRTVRVVLTREGAM